MQGVHVAMLVARVVAEYVPGPQGVQSVSSSRPVLLDQVPAGQLRQLADEVPPVALR